jgi:type IX secretion system PorP/SprF family membrane protein
MKNLTKSLVITLTLLTVDGLFGQDAHFSQYRMTPLLLNPGNAGMNSNIRAVANYREQWKSVSTPFKTFAFSFDMNTSKKKQNRASMGLGLQLINDKAGDSRLGLTQGNLNLSGILDLSDDSKLSVGIMGGFGQRSADYSSLRWDNQYQGGTYLPGASTGENFSTPNFTYMDAGAGFVWSYGKEQGYITQNNGFKMNFGASVFHFGLPQTSFLGNSEEKMNTKFIAHTSAEIGKLNTNLTFIPEIYFLQQGPQREIIIGNVFRYLLQEGSQFSGFKKSSAVSLGLNYRFKDALITSAIIDYANYTVAFSYDINISPLSTSSKSRGGFEIAIRFVTPNPFSKNSRARI